MTQCETPWRMAEEAAAGTWLVGYNWHHFYRAGFHTVKLNSRIPLRILPTDILAHLWNGLGTNLFAAALF